MNRHAAGQAPAVQQSVEADQWSSRRAEYMQEFQGRYQLAVQMHHFLYHLGKKHKGKRYDQVFEDQDYVCWVKAHWRRGHATREQQRFLHYIQLQERGAGAVAEPVPEEPVEDPAAEEPVEEPVEDPAEEEYDFLDQEAEAVSMEQLAARMGQVEQVLEALMERLHI
jgi:hypothetical protein